MTVVVQGRIRRLDCGLVALVVIGGGWFAVRAASGKTPYGDFGDVNDLIESNGVTALLTEAEGRYASMRTVGGLLIAAALLVAARFLLDVFRHRAERWGWVLAFAASLSILGATLSEDPTWRMFVDVASVDQAIDP